MSIDLRCPGCQKLLRVADSAAGKQARCPECGTLVVVPAGNAASASPTPASAPTPSPTGPSPFASSPAPSQPPQQPAVTTPAPAWKPAMDQSNPYAASGFYEATPGIGASADGALGLRSVSFDQVLGTTWKIFSNNLGPMAILGLFSFVALIINQVIAFGIGIVIGIIGDPIVNIGGQLVQQVIGMVVSAIIATGSLHACFNLLRSGRTEPGDFMAFSRFFVRAVLKDLLIALMVFVPAMLFMSPGFIALAAGAQDVAPFIILVAVVPIIVLMLFVFLSTFLSYQFIVDRDFGVVDSLKASWQYMNGNKLTAFLVMLVVGMASGLFACVTCGIGTVLTMPYLYLLMAVFYLMATGQADQISPAAFGPQYAYGQPGQYPQA